MRVSKAKVGMVGIALLGLLMAPNAIAAMDWDDRTRFNPDAARFSEREWSFDLFGTYATRNRDDFTDGSGGLGVGLNYFFTEYFGVGADTYLDDFELPNHLDASFIARYPIEEYSLAPYALAGFGRQFDDVPQWSAHVGIGAEYRFNRRTGFFGEIRGVFPDKSRDFALFRFGLRVGF